MKVLSLGTLCLTVVLSACSQLPRSSTDKAAVAAATSVGIDGIACVGPLQPPPPGLTPVQDAALLQQALGKSGAGKICAGQVYQASQPIQLYRVWDSSKSYTQLGQWWSATLAQGPKAAYQRANAICPSWSALDQQVSCQLKAGSLVVIGNTQSADCGADGVLEKNATVQWFVANDGRNNHYLVDNCQDLGAWPEPAPAAASSVSNARH